MPTIAELYGNTAPTQEPELDAMTYTGGAEGTFGLSDLTADHNFNVIKAQMKSRFGMTEDNHERQDIVDKWVNYNRKFNVGSTLSVLGEASYLSKADDTEKVQAFNSYKLWDNMKGAFEGGTAAQKLDNVYDYGMALIADPMNLVSFGVGKLATGGASKIAAATAKEALEISANKIISKAGQTGVARSALKPAVKAEIDQARRRVLSKALKGQAVEGLEDPLVMKTALKTARTKELRTGVAVETVAALGVDYVQQKAAYMKVGYQQEYSYLNSALIAGGGFFGYGLAKAIPLLSGDELPKSMALDVFDAAVAAEAAAKKRAREEGIALNKEALKSLMDNPDAKATMIKDVKASREAAERWAKIVAEGQDTAKGLKDEGITSSIDTVEGVNAFLNGVKKGPNQFEGMADILTRNGIELSYEDDVWKGLVHFLSETTVKLPDEVKGEVQTLYEATIKRLDSGFEKVNTLDEAMPLMAAKFSYAGSLMNTAGQLGRVVKEVKRKKAALGDGSSLTPEELLDGIVDPATGEYVEAVTKKAGTFESLQNNLIRTLVTHPGTTALNLLGWAHASTLQSASDAIRGTLYGGASMGKLLMGDTVGSVEYAKKAKLMMTLQSKKMSNLVNPFATQEETLNFLSANPKLQKELFRYISGGVDSKDVMKSLDIDLDDLEKPDKFDQILDKFQTYYGVKAVDVLTKTQEFMYNIDKQIRIKYNVSYDEFMSAKDADGMPKYWDKMRSSDFFEVQTAAVEDSLRNVFAKSYGGGDFNANRNTVESIAKIIEDARKFPIVGAMIPFGQFFNNTIAFMADHSGVSIAHKYFTGNNRDLMELATKTAVGWTAVAAAAQYEYSAMEEGLAWHEERDDDGQVRSRLYDFPYSYWKGVGRIVAHIQRDGEVPGELFDDITKTFGPANLTRALGETNNQMYDMVKDAASGNFPDALEAVQKFAGGTASMYLSAFSRPLDPINQVAAFAMGDAYNETDRNIGSKFVNNSVRYVENIFDSLDYFTGLKTVEGAKAVGEFVGLDVEGEAVPRQRITEDRPRGVAIGRIFGYRDSPAPQALDKMFSDVGMPKWKTSIKSDIPEANNTINRVITPYLEEEAARVVYKEGWKDASVEVKKTMLSKALTIAKNRALRELYTSGNPTDKRHLLMYDISKRGSKVSKEDIETVLDEIGIDKKVTDLSYDELKLLRNFLAIEKLEKKREAYRIRKEVAV